MKQLSLFLLLWISASLFAAAPSSYYDSAEGKSERSLKTALSKIIDDHHNVGYDGLYNVYKDSDDKNGQVWDMYSTCTWSHGNKKCGNYKNICDCYNREHVIPQSWFNKRSPMVSDAFQVVPSDGKVNGMRSNYPHGETNASDIGGKGLGKVGSSSVSGYSGSVYEPIDEYKGDIARMYFYFVTRYESNMSSFDGSVLQKNTYPSLDTWFYTLMLEWHREDPVSQKELDRQEGVYKHQDNRNPFIDYPALAEHIWGDSKNIPWDPNASSTDPYISEPSSGSSLEFNSAPVNTTTSDLVIVKGGNLTGDLAVSISGNDASNFTISGSSISESEVESTDGAHMVVKFTPTALKNYSATLTISGGGLTGNIIVNLTGEGSNDFKAVDASNITPTSFTANWSSDFGATAYNLNVFTYVEGGEVEDVEIYNASFASETFPEGITKESGYSAFADRTLRMGSGSNGCEILLPAIDLSSNNVTLTVNARQYNNDTGAPLFVEVDGTKVGSIKTTETMTAHSILLGTHTSTSKIALSVGSGERVFLQDIAIINKGKTQTEEPLEGYPMNVGNILSYTVDVQDFSKEYYYNVSSEGGSASTTNTVKVEYSTTTNDNIVDTDMLWYKYDNSIIIEGLEGNNNIAIYSINGVLVNTFEAEGAATINMNNCSKGIYLIKIMNESTCHTVKIAY